MPQRRQNSMLRALTMLCLGMAMAPSRFSISRQSTPRWPRSQASPSPTGPAPTISTAVSVFNSIEPSLRCSFGWAHCRAPQGGTIRRDAIRICHIMKMPVVPHNARQRPSIEWAQEEAMQRIGWAVTGAALMLAGLGVPNAAWAQPYYAGKTLRVIVGLEAGGTVDTFARTFSGYLRQHIPGNPTILVQNMPGAGGKTATNHVFERAPPDGLTILYGPWDPLAQALGDQGLRARYEKFEFLGGTGDIRVIYARRDAVTGGTKAPADIVKAENLALGSLNNTDISGLLPHLALRVLGVKHRLVVGYRG